MRIEDIQIHLIDIPEDRRVVDLMWAEAFSSDMVVNGQITPIEVVQTGERYRLISGAHRIEARKLLGASHVTAEVRDIGEFKDETDLILREIAENMMRRGLSVLDKAWDIFRWRGVYERAHGAVKAGRKKNRVKSDPISDAEIDAAAEAFAESFTAAAQAALGFNKEAIKRFLRIASIPRDLQKRIALHASIADNQSELLALAAQAPERQTQIVALLLAEPPAAASVAAAIAIMDRVPPVAPAEPWAKLSDKFARLTNEGKRRFLDEHWDLIEDMLAERSTRKVA